MGFLSIKKSKNNSDIIPLNERDNSQYKVKQVYKVGRSKSQKEVRILVLTEEGVKVLDTMTGVCLPSHRSSPFSPLAVQALTLP
jgi:hypothetical protein